MIHAQHNDHSPIKVSASFEPMSGSINSIEYKKRSPFPSLCSHKGSQIWEPKQRLETPMCITERIKEYKGVELLKEDRRGPNNQIIHRDSFHFFLFFFLWAQKRVD